MQPFVILHVLSITINDADMKPQLLVFITLLTCLSGCELFDTEPDYHVEKYYGLYRCNYHHFVNSWQGNNLDSLNLVRDSVYLVISKGAGKNEVAFSTPNDSLFPTPRSIHYDDNYKRFMYDIPGGSHMHSSCNIKFNGDSVRLDYDWGMYGAEKQDILVGVKEP